MSFLKADGVVGMLLLIIGGVQELDVTLCI